MLEFVSHSDSGEGAQPPRPQGEESSQLDCEGAAGVTELGRRPSGVTPAAGTSDPPSGPGPDEGADVVLEPEHLPEPGAQDLAAEASDASQGHLESALGLPPLQRSHRARRLVKKDLPKAPVISAEQRLLLLDTWRRSGLPV